MLLLFIRLSWDRFIECSKHIETADSLWVDRMVATSILTLNSLKHPFFLHYVNPFLFFFLHTSVCVKGCWGCHSTDEMHHLEKTKQKHVVFLFFCERVWAALLKCVDELFFSSGTNKSTKVDFSAPDFQIFVLSCNSLFTLLHTIPLPSLSLYPYPYYLSSLPVVGCYPAPFSSR